MGVPAIDERQAAALAGELYQDVLSTWTKRNWVAMHGRTWLKRLCDEGASKASAGHSG